MPDAVGVRFRPCGKIYNFEVDGISAKPGMRIIVESEMGLNLGVVVIARHKIEEPEQQLKKILRLATVEDMETDRNNRLFEEEARAFCIEKVKSRNLPMKVVGTESTLDRKRLIFYFAAEGRIDFRELVRDLASKFRTRIEMRQIGVRDEVKLMGGMGVCGREVCCKIFLTSFEPISIRMAKKQELALNPGKLSGICGRLMCCLGYEVESPERKENEARVESSESIALQENEPIVVTKENITNAEKTGEPAVLAIDTPAESRGAEKAQAIITHQPLKLPGKNENEQPAGGKRHHRHEWYKHEKKDKGKPFSRRKKFFKKKEDDKKH